MIHAGEDTCVATCDRGEDEFRGEGLGKPLAALSGAPDAQHLAVLRAAAFRDGDRVRNCALRLRRTTRICDQVLSRGRPTAAHAKGPRRSASRTFRWTETYFPSRAFTA